MVIFHSYVKLPEGNIHYKPTPQPSTSKATWPRHGCQWRLGHCRRGRSASGGHGTYGTWNRPSSGRKNKEFTGIIWEFWDIYIYIVLITIINGVYKPIYNWDIYIYTMWCPPVINWLKKNVTLVKSYLLKVLFFAMLVFWFWGWDSTNLALGTHGVTWTFWC